MLDTGAIFAAMSEALPPFPPISYDISSASEAASMTLAGALAELARVGDVIALSGDIGAGKTVFARGFVQALTTAGEEVPSPTFTLVQSYDCAPGPVHHYDFYRLERAIDAYEIGIEESFAEAITLIEWPARIASLRSEHWLDILFSTDTSDPGIRDISLRGGPSWSGRLATLASTNEGFAPAGERLSGQNSKHHG